MVCPRVGIALGRPGEKVIGLFGDGSSMYSIQALWNAVQLRLPVSFIIIKNGRYEALHEFSRRFGLREAVGTRLPGIDFCALAGGLGCRAIHVDGVSHLDEALRSAFADDIPTLVEVIVE